MIDLKELVCVFILKNTTLEDMLVMIGSSENPIKEITKNHSWKVNKILIETQEDFKQNNSSHMTFINENI